MKLDAKAVAVAVALAGGAPSFAEAGAAKAVVSNFADNSVSIIDTADCLESGTGSNGSELMSQ